MIHGLALPLMNKGRRLQIGGLPTIVEHSPTHDLWVLGGVFLEHFVSIYDFDDKRLGFCEPSGSHGLTAAQTGDFSALQVGGGQVLNGSMLLLVVTLAIGGLAILAVILFFFYQGRGCEDPNAMMARSTYLQTEENQLED